MPSSKPERRQSVRQPLQVPVDYSAVDAFFSDFSANINEGGIFIATDSPAELDTVVQLQFKVPGQDAPLQLAGRVAWVSDGKGEAPAGMGIEFHELTHEARETINQLVKRLRKDG